MESTSYNSLVPSLKLTAIDCNACVLRERQTQERVCLRSHKHPQNLADETELLSSSTYFGSEQMC